MQRIDSFTRPARMAERRDRMRLAPIIPSRPCRLRHVGGRRRQRKGWTKKGRRQGIEMLTGLSELAIVSNPPLLPPRHSSACILKPRSCSYPTLVALSGLLHSTLLFLHFYPVYLCTTHTHLQASPRPHHRLQSWPPTTKRTTKRGLRPPLKIATSC